MQVFGRDVQLVSKGVVERETPRVEGRKELEDGSKVPVVSWDYCFLGARNRTIEAEVEQRGDSPVLMMHDGVTKSIFAHSIPARVDFPSCEKVVTMVVKDLDGHFRLQQSGVDVTMSPPFSRCSGR